MKSIVVLIMLASIAAAYETPSLVLDKMFVNLGTFNYFENGIGFRKIYFVSRDIKLAWSHSLMFCRSFGMDLVTLPTEEENNVFTKLCADNATYFDEYTHVGGSNLGLNNWFWTSNGQPIKYQLKFAPGEPNNSGGREYYLAISKQLGSFKFNDVPGYGAREEKFVCEHISK